MRRVVKSATSLILPLALLTIWELAHRAEMLPIGQFAAPSAIASTIGELFTSGGLPSHLAFSTSRLVVGCFLGVVLGAIVGILVAITPALGKSSGATLSFLAGIPVVVWMPVWIAFFGTGEVFRTGLVAIAAFFLNYVVAFLAAKRASREFIEVAALFGKSRLVRLSAIFLPATVEQLFVSLRISLAFGWIILFFVEYAVSQSGSEGIGWFVANARAVGRIEDEFAGLVALGITAFVLDRLVGYIQKSLLVWSDTVEDE